MVACINDDDPDDGPVFKDIDRGTIEANHIKITFFPRNNTSQRSTFEYYDPDGPGGAAPTINDTIRLQAPASSFFDYQAEIEFLNDADTVTDNIESLGTKYIICYRNLDRALIRLTERNDDSSGKDLGTESEWSTVAAGTGTMFVTLNFQNARKEGVCDAGVRIFEADLNFKIQ